MSSYISAKNHVAWVVGSSGADGSSTRLLTLEFDSLFYVQSALSFFLYEF